MLRVRLTVNGKFERELDVVGELTVGRKEPAQIVIADSQVSSRHATLRADGDGLVVTDLGSTNGTRIDAGERLQPNVGARVERGQKVVIGPAVLEVVSRGADVESSGAFGKAPNTVLVRPDMMQELLVSVARFQAAKPRLVIGAEHVRRTVEISEMEVVVGRESAEAQVVVPHQSVSTRHARISFAGGAFHVEDLDSANGTFVGGTRISAKTPLEPQTAVTFGTVDCLFVARAPEAGGAEGAADPYSEILSGHAVRLGRATEQQAREALTEHRTSGRTLGEIFVEKGLFPPREWAEVYRNREAIRVLHARAAPAQVSTSRTAWIVAAVLAVGALAALAWLQGWLGGGAR